MDEEYDYIILGTGLKECIISGLLSCVAKKTVLHTDRNAYYGGESASLNLNDLYKRFPDASMAKLDEKERDAKLGRSRDYCVDLCPKLIMSCGDLVKTLIQTRVTRYLDFRSVSGSYITQKENVQKVPVTAKEALASPLMGMFQKRRFKAFVTWVNDYEAENPKTWSGQDLDKVTCIDLMKYWKLTPETMTFTGHALALYTNDDYLNKPSRDMVERIKLYAHSTARYGNSPYIYPMYGLGGLPEGFSRLCAVHGGVYMLNTPIDEIIYNTEGVATGVRVGDKTAKCRSGVVADPSYFLGTDKVKAAGQVARLIAIMDHPIANTANADSAQIILPASDTKRKHDIYISLVSYEHSIASKGKYVAVLSTTVENEKDPKADLAPAIKLLGATIETFFWVSDSYVPTSDGKKDNCFITSTYDATTNFSTCTEEVLQMYETITGEKVDLSGDAKLGEDDE